MPVARYRDRHSVAGRKSGHGDSLVLAGVLRTDMHAHRPLPAGSELAQAIAVLARAQQDAVWDRTTAHNKLRSRLREYFPGFLAAFAGLDGGILRPEARVILAAAPTSAAAAGALMPVIAQVRGQPGLQRPPEHGRDQLTQHGPGPGQPQPPAASFDRSSSASSSRPSISSRSGTRAASVSPAAPSSRRGFIPPWKGAASLRSGSLPSPGIAVSAPVKSPVTVVSTVIPRPGGCPPPSFDYPL